MKKIFALFIFSIFLLSVVTAEISLTNEPKSLYNLNDKIELNVKITPNPTINDLVVLKLVCPESEIEIYKEYLVTNKEIQKIITVPLVKEFIKNSLGSCSIVSTVGSEKRTLSKVFTISNKLIITINKDGREMSPGNVVSLVGHVIRENKKLANGIIEVSIDGEKNVFANSKLMDGDFAVEIPLPDNFRAGSHKLAVKAYEKNKFDQTTNEGTAESLINVLQVPKNLEIILDKKEVIPGEFISGNFILRDQTGEKIKSKVYLAVKNDNGEIIKKIEGNTDEKFNYKIEKGSSPNLWKLSAYASDVISSVDFKILENKKVTINLINNTLSIENTGNVYYNDTVYVNIGEKKVPVKVSLAVGEMEKYNIYAPTGEYKVAFNGVEKTSILTGDAIKIEKISASTLNVVKIVVWAFLILILALVSYIFFKKGNKKTFLGRKTGKQAKSPIELKELPKASTLTNTKTKGELSISITGSRQNSPIGCISLKNYEEIKDGQGGVLETFSKISELIENEKGVIYENKGNIFYILPPIRTKTFSNEIPIIKISEKIKGIINSHNKKFKKKINFGIGINYGTIVTKEENGVFKFMSMGTLMTIAKKIANRSNGIILMNDKFKEKLDTTVKVEKVAIESMNVFKFNSINEKKDNSAFINNFLAKNKFN